MTLQERLAPVKAWWAARAPRERRLVVVGTAVVGALLVVALGILPAWRTLGTAPAQLEVLEEQLQSMQRLAAETKELRAAPPVSMAQSIAALQAASGRLGDKGRLAVQGDRATLTVNGAGTSQLRGWLSEVRSGARARPIEANLTRGAGGYNGTIVVAVGGAP